MSRTAIADTRDLTQASRQLCSLKTCPRTGSRAWTLPCLNVDQVSHVPLGLRDGLKARSREARLPAQCGICPRLGCGLSFPLRPISPWSVKWGSRTRVPPSGSDWFGPADITMGCSLRI